LDVNVALTSALILLILVLVFRQLSPTVTTPFR